MVRVVIPLAALFLWWITVFGSARVLPSPAALSYSTLTYDVSTHDPETYRNIINQLREELAKNGTVYEGVPVLPPNVEVSSLDRFVLLKLERYNVLVQPVTLALDVIDAQIVGFQVETESYFFDDVPESIISDSPLFMGTNKSRLPFGGSYQSLEANGASRENTILGTYPLYEATAEIYNYATHNNNSINIAPSLLVVKQMISEAARLEFVAYEVFSYFEVGFRPGCDVISLEDNWTFITIAIRLAIHGNVIVPFDLKYADCTTYTVHRVADVLPKMGLLREWFDWPCKEVEQSHAVLI